MTLITPAQLKAYVWLHANAHLSRAMMVHAIDYHHRTHRLKLEIARKLRDRLPSGREALMAMCKKYDANGDGKISKHELRVVLAELHIRLEGDQMERLMAEFDHFHTGI